MKLDTRHFLELRDHGFTIIPGAVSSLLTNRALKAIHHNFGHRGIDPARFNEYRARSYCPEVRDTSAISDLFNLSPLAALAQSVFGERPLQPVNGGQVALRFPTDADLPGVASPHIDGTDYEKRSSGDQPPPVGELQSFSMLCGIFLADVPEVDAGNFTVWPGTHRIVSDWIRQHGIEELAQPGSVTHIRDRVDWPDPVQITAAAGDAVFAHHFTAHGITPNLSHRIRYACFYRLHCQDHASHRHAIFHEDMWLEWDGLRNALG